MLTKIIAEKRIYQAKADTHKHGYAQLIWPLRGQLHMKTAVHTLDLDEEGFFYLPPACQHTFFAQQANECLVFDVPVGPLTAAAAAPLMRPLTDKWRALRYLLLTETGSPNNQLDYLLRYTLAHLTQGERPRSIQHLHDHFNTPLTLTQLAHIEGYNPAYYATWFKTQTGLTVKQYQQQLRLTKAKELLTHTNQSLQQIAHTVGYKHQASLTRLFQQQEGVPPLTYRT